ncbi:hypothetical protein QC823_13300 [Halomonas vilamensis]|uniref:Sn-glycerol-3-phosphate transporter n=1 Tax=Vreelandella vilamensis TaxID=531309 RepID=A0ABU1H776_9GAMM|nr:hypothetical protein [Halomonas vilamensis]MDR5899965.1 hypothetical protein [Halomonas vilamensis]
MGHLTRATLLTALLPSSAAAEWRERFQESLDWPPTLTVDHVLVQTSLYTHHFGPDPEHTDQQQLISAEIHTPDRWLAGGARFKNSFNQESVYVYAGKSFPLWQPNATFMLRGKLTVGLLHGYRGEYRDKIPFNRYEIAPAALLSIGVRWHRVESDLIVFGTAGMMLTAGVRF